MPKGIGIADWTEVKIEHQGNNYGQVDEKTYYAWERKAEFREIWISKGKQASPALSNDFGTSLEDLVRQMTRRWGAQENMFKELNGYFRIVLTKAYACLAFSKENAGWSAGAHLFRDCGYSGWLYHRYRFETLITQELLIYVKYAGVQIDQL